MDHQEDGHDDSPTMLYHSPQMTANLLHFANPIVAAASRRADDVVNGHHGAVRPANGEGSSSLDALAALAGDLPPSHGGASGEPPQDASSTTPPWPLAAHFMQSLMRNFPHLIPPGVNVKQEPKEHPEQSPANHLQEDDMSEGVSPKGDVEEDSGDDIRRGTAQEHDDVLNKLKMQVRDIKVGDEYEGSRMMNFPAFGKGMEGFALGSAPPFPFSHPPAFLPPIAPPAQAGPSPGSSHSSEGSTSSQHNWSFEEQFKQLYEINDDPKRKEFLDDLFTFMQRRGTPINRLPIMAKSVLDLFELYNLVIARGGLVDVINKKLWQEIIKGLHLPSSITSAAFTLRTQYMKYLYPYECEKRKLSTPQELQAAIDGNRREGRRSSYGQYDSPRDGQQINPLAHQQLARMQSMMNSNLAQLHNGAHHPSHPTPLGQPLNGTPIPGLAANDLETRMVEYMKMLNKEILCASPRTGTSEQSLSPQVHVDRMALWGLYNTQQQPPPVVPEQREALNLSEVSHNNNNLTVQKRASSEEASPPPPPAKRIAREEPEATPTTPRSQHSSNMKIRNTSDPRTGESSVVITMDLNGVSYSGVLFPSRPTSNGSATNRI